MFHTLSFSICIEVPISSVLVLNSSEKLVEVSIIWYDIIFGVEIYINSAVLDETVSYMNKRMKA